MVDQGATSHAGTGIDLRGLGPHQLSYLSMAAASQPSNAPGSGYTDISASPTLPPVRIGLRSWRTAPRHLWFGMTVGGVVTNFVLKRDFEGADTNVRYGRSPKGSLHGHGS